VSATQPRLDHLFPKWVAPTLGGFLVLTFCGLIASDFKRIEIKSETLPPPPKDLTVSTLRLRSDPKSKVLDGITDPAEEITKLREQLKAAENKQVTIRDAVARFGTTMLEKARAEADQLRADKDRLQKANDQLTEENSKLTKDTKRAELQAQFAKARQERAEAKAADLSAASLVSSAPMLKFQGSAMMGKSLVPKLADAFVKQGGQATFNILISSDSEAESAVADGKADVCMTPFTLRDKTREKSWETTFLGNGGVAFVGSITNGISGLTNEEVLHFLDGTAQEWPSRKEGQKSLFLHVPGLSDNDEPRRLLSSYFPGMKVGSNARLYGEASQLCTILAHAMSAGKIAESEVFVKSKRPNTENFWIAVGAVFRTQEKASGGQIFSTDWFKLIPIDDKFPGDSGYRYGFGLSLRYRQKAEGALAAFLAYCRSSAGQKIVVEEGFRTN
jgi:hypothetical protein